MEKYYYSVKVMEEGGVEADNKKKAMEKIKEIWLDEHNIDLADKEITIK